MESNFSNKTSEFSNNNSLETYNIDFKTVKPLKTGGSTCNTYAARVNGRLLFVKRLKEEFRNKPIYRNAFQKEFEVGGMLRHKSLPVYLEYRNDYICLDYIDGQTLSDMISEYDPWLTDKKNIERLLEELLDVLAYLHDKNVIHCDIKTDNIMLTFGSHNLFLIDLDKCYTSWYDNTAGSSEKYGMRENAKKDAAMDFRGIGRLLDELEKGLPGFPSETFKIFKEECFFEGVSIDDLKNLLKEISKSEEGEKKPNYRRIKARHQEPVELNPRDQARLEWMRKDIDDSLVILDGPLKYNISKSTNEMSVECREDVRKACFEVNIVNPYKINGKDYYVTTVPIRAFSECVNLKSIILPEGITILHRATFMDCTKLEHVRIPASIETVIGGVFSGCPNLKKVEFENPANISSFFPDFIYKPNDTLEIVDLSSGVSYSYEDFIKKYDKTNIE